MVRKRTFFLGWLGAMVAFAGASAAEGGPAVPRGFEGVPLRPREIARTIRAKFLPDLTGEQEARLRGLAGEFRSAVEERLPALREAGERFAGALREVWAELSAEEKAKCRELAKKLRELPPLQKLGVLAGTLGAEGIEGLKGEVSAWISAGHAAARLEAGEKVARRIAGAAGSYLERALGLDAARMAVLKSAFERLLEETRPARRALEEVAWEKLDAAWGILTDLQRERVEKAKAWVLGFLRGGES
ncbi:MAG: hypothetical protein ACUVYA_08850 [Planctomycetota bacterium]